MSTYNGWSNYETWLVKLWMDNDEDSCRYWQEQAQCARSERENARFVLANMLKDEHEESMPEVAGVYLDLLAAVLGEINWREIADSLLEDAEDTEEESEEETL